MSINQNTSSSTSLTPKLLSQPQTTRIAMESERSLKSRARQRRIEQMTPAVLSDAARRGAAEDVRALRAMSLRGGRPLQGTEIPWSAIAPSQSHATRREILNLQAALGANVLRARLISLDTVARVREDITGLAETIVSNDEVKIARLQATLREHIAQGGSIAEICAAIPPESCTQFEAILPHDLCVWYNLGLVFYGNDTQSKDAMEYLASDWDHEPFICSWQPSEAFARELTTWISDRAAKEKLMKLPLLHYFEALMAPILLKIAKQVKSGTNPASQYLNFLNMFTPLCASTYLQIPSMEHVNDPVTLLHPYLGPRSEFYIKQAGRFIVHFEMLANAITANIASLDDPIITSYIRNLGCDLEDREHPLGRFYATILPEHRDLFEHVLNKLKLETPIERHKIQIQLHQLFFSPNMHTRREIAASLSPNWAMHIPREDYMDLMTYWIDDPTQRQKFVNFLAFQPCKDITRKMLCYIEAIGEGKWLDLLKKFAPLCRPVFIEAMQRGSDDDKILLTAMVPYLCDLPSSQQAIPWSSIAPNQTPQKRKEILELLQRMPCLGNVTGAKNTLQRMENRLKQQLQEYPLPFNLESLVNNIMEVTTESCAQIIARMVSSNRDRLAATLQDRLHGTLRKEHYTKILDFIIELDTQSIAHAMRTLKSHHSMDIVAFGRRADRLAVLARERQESLPHITPMFISDCLKNATPQLQRSILTRLMRIPPFKASMGQQCRKALETADAAANEFIQHMMVACAGMLSTTLENEIQAFFVNQRYPLSDDHYQRVYIEIDIPPLDLSINENREFEYSIKNMFTEVFTAMRESDPLLDLTAFENSLDTFIGYCVQLTPRLATPRMDQPEALRAFYSDIKRSIIHVIAHIRRAEREGTMSAEEIKRKKMHILSELKSVAQVCGTGQIAVAEDLYQEIVVGRAVTLETAIFKCLNGMRWADSLIAVRSNDVHEYSAFMHRVGTQLAIPGARVFQRYRDPFITQTRIHAETDATLRRRFEILYTPSNIIDAVAEEIGPRGTQATRNLLLEWCYDHIPDNWGASRQASDWGLLFDDIQDYDRAKAEIEALDLHTEAAAAACLARHNILIGRTSTMFLDGSVMGHPMAARQALAVYEREVRRAAYMAREVYEAYPATTVKKIYVKKILVQTGILEQASLL